MNLKQYEYIMTLANKKSFSLASEELGISQPSLSQYVKRIEKENGVALFERLNGEVRLTDAGRAYIKAGREILDIEHRMRGMFNDLAEHKAGSIVIGTSPYRSAGMMPSVVKKFQEKYPGMHLVIEEMTSQELIDAAEHGQFDLCLTMLPINEQLFSYERIAEEELVLAVPNYFPPIQAISIPSRKYPAIDATAVNHQPFVMITESQWMQRALDCLSIDYHLSLKKAAVVKSLEAHIAMVRAGVGMALLPSGIERFCAPDEVTFYSFKQALPKREVAVIWRRECPPTQVTKALVQLMKEISW